MILETVYRIGNMLGLKHDDINSLIPEGSSPISTQDIEVPFSPLDNYKMEGGFYGTISINDF